MNTRNTGMILTVVTALLCGLPGICLCLFGGLAAAGVLPYNVDINGTTQQGQVPPGVGAGMLVVALLLILIPVIIGVITLRRRPAAPPPPPPNYNEPLPPAS